MKKFLLAAIVFTLTACGQVPQPQTPAQAVYALESAYAAALSAEVTYSKLPKCKAEQVAVVNCSKPEVVRKVKTASDVAWNAIKAAETAVRTDGFGSEIATTAYSTATAALKAYTDITLTLNQ